MSDATRDNTAYDKFEDERTDKHLVDQFGVRPDFVVDSPDAVPAHDNAEYVKLEGECGAVWERRPYADDVVVAAIRLALIGAADDAAAMRVVGVLLDAAEPSDPGATEPVRMLVEALHRADCVIIETSP